MAVKCPSCGANNPDHSWQCACGHYFITTMPKAPLVDGTAEPPRTESEGAPESKTHRILFHGDGGTLLGISLVNLLLTMLTLGVYYFWVKVRVRQYLYSQTEFEGDRFGYHGTGKELLTGWLKAMALFGGFFALLILNGMLWQGVWQAVVGQVLFYGGLLLLAPVAVVGAQRYRLSRTSWRGIRFSFRGHAPELMRLLLRDGIFVALTLGLYVPFLQNHFRIFLARNSYFGTEPFSYDGDGWELFKMHLLMIFLLFPTLGLYWFWYTANKQRYYWDNTRFGGARFRSTVTGEGLAELKILNFLLIVFTFGIGYPLARIREARYLAANLLVEGPLDVGRIRQQAVEASATGDALADAMDFSLLDMDLGF